MNSANNNTDLSPLTLVKAGAGAGKTYKIQQELTSWVQAKKVRPDRILAVTFTNAAANEMRERIRHNLISKSMLAEAELVQDSTITTIHGFGIEIIEQFAYEKGISPSPRLLNDLEQDHLIRIALNQVESIQPVLDDLNKFNYKGKYKGDNFIDGASQLKLRILDVIKEIRILGKDSNPETAINLSRSALNYIKSIYGQNLSKADTLNKALWDAIKAVKQIYSSEILLMPEWGSNFGTRAFVNTIYSVTEASIKHDWKSWAKLQTVNPAPKFFGKQGEHKHAQLALNIWNAADNLCIHPGPLDDAIVHIESLLNGAIDTLVYYQDLKKEAGLIDFNDMVHLAENILKTPYFLAEIKEHYDCLIIDEFQDTNPLQFSLLRQFQKAGLPTLIVGDLKQSIMGFQGADSRLFASLLKSSENSDTAEVEELKNNWRSTSRVMQFVNEIGEHLYNVNYQPLTVTEQANYSSQLVPVHRLIFDSNAWGLGKSKNKPSIGDGGQFVLANHIANILKQDIEITDKKTGKKRQLREGDIAVLAPRHKQLYHFSEELNKLGIQTKISQKGLISSEAVQWILSALKFISNTQHDYALLDLLTSNYEQASLEQVLQEYIDKKAFSHPIASVLKENAEAIQLMDFHSTVLKVAELLNVWEKIKQRNDGEQQRVNVIKLIEHATNFQQTKPESLRAMGIYGKNLETFQVWLNENIEQEGFDEQPGTKLDAENMIVLSTWHAAKGLEWPIVMVLGCYDKRTNYLPTIDVAYESDDVDKMLDSSFVRFLMDFDDPKTKDKMLAELQEASYNTQKNLIYVALTRAREQIILPWFEADKELPGTVQSLIEPVFVKSNFQLVDSNLVPMEVPDDNEQIFFARQGIKLSPVVSSEAKCERLPAMISPSVHDESETIFRTVVSSSYADGLELATWDNVLEANEIGTWIHRFYQIYFMNQSMLDKGFELLPDTLFRETVCSEIKAHIDEFDVWLQSELKPISIKCELPVLAMNDLGQTISGSIDMLIETPNEYMILDHKTDIEMDFSTHFYQLKAYANAIHLDKPIINLGINWIRFGKVEWVNVN